MCSVCVVLLCMGVRCVCVGVLITYPALPLEIFVSVLTWLVENKELSDFQSKFHAKLTQTTSHIYNVTTRLGNSRFFSNRVLCYDFIIIYKSNKKNAAE